MAEGAGEGAGLGWWQGAGSGPGARAAPPHLPPSAQQLTPQSHEDGKDHGALVVEEVSELGTAAARLGTAFRGLPPPTPRLCRGRPSTLLVGEDGRRGPPGGGGAEPPEPQTLANTQVSESRWYLRPWSPRGHSRMSSASQISLLRAQGRAGGGSPLTRGGGVPEGPCPPPPRAPGLPSPPDLTGVEQGEAAQEDDEAGHRSGHQHVCVPAQPGEVQGHLLAKVVPVGRLPRQTAPPHPRM